MAKQVPGNGAFRGVSFLLKDLAYEWAGTPMKSGSVGYQHYVSEAEPALPPAKGTILVVVFVGS